MLFGGGSQKRGLQHPAALVDTQADSYLKLWNWVIFMNSDPSLDRQSFEAFLANALAVQQSGLDSQSLFAIIQVQQFLTTAEFNLDRALHLIAERALKIANASGVTIALLESNQLVYRAGSGRAAIEIGRHVPAVLSAQREVRAEILRVEDAQNDLRVQAELCRQFGAISLMILPTYDKGGIAGVLQVQFSEAHSFLDREVRAYRMMAGLVEEAMLREQGRTKEAPATYTGIAAVAQGNSAAEQISIEAAKSPAQAVLVQSPAMDWDGFGIESMRHFVEVAHRLFRYKIWPVAASVSASILLAIVISTAHDHHSVSSPIGRAALMPNKTDENLSPGTVDASGNVSSPKAKGEAAHTSAFRRVRVGSTEVDYIADDVTIRQFTNRAARPQTRVGERRVDMGEDVTIRYFSSNSVSKSRAVPIPTALQKANNSAPTPVVLPY